MKVLVTGATGFIGGNVARALVNHGYAALAGHGLHGKAKLPRRAVQA